MKTTSLQNITEFISLNILSTNYVSGTFEVLTNDTVNKNNKSTL